MGAFRNTNAVLIEAPEAAKYSPYTDTWEMAEKSIYTPTAAVLVNGTDVFNVAGGPIMILDLISVCVTANDATASTLQWRADGVDGSVTGISAASASLANAAAGTIVSVLFTATSTAPAVYANGVGISRAATTATNMLVPAGVIDMAIGVGSTTGTWRHYMRYRPMVRGVVVTVI